MVDTMYEKNIFASESEEYMDCSSDEMQPKDNVSLTRRQAFRWTEAMRLHLINAVIEVERQNATPKGKWGKVLRRLPLGQGFEKIMGSQRGLSRTCLSTHHSCCHQFYNLRREYKFMLRTGTNPKWSRKLTKEVCKKLADYEKFTKIRCSRLAYVPARRSSSKTVSRIIKRSTSRVLRSARASNSTSTFKLKHNAHSTRTAAAVEGSFSFPQIQNMQESASVDHDDQVHAAAVEFRENSNYASGCDSEQPHKKPPEIKQSSIRGTRASGMKDVTYSKMTTSLSAEDLKEFYVDEENVSAVKRNTRKRRSDTLSDHLIVEYSRDTDPSNSLEARQEDIERRANLDCRCHVQKRTAETSSRRITIASKFEAQSLRDHTTSPSAESLQEYVNPQKRQKSDQRTKRRAADHMKDDEIWRDAAPALEDLPEPGHYVNEDNGYGSGSRENTGKRSSCRHRARADDSCPSTKQNSRSTSDSRSTKECYDLEHSEQTSLERLRESLNEELSQLSRWCRHHMVPSGKKVVHKAVDSVLHNLKRSRPAHDSSKDLIAACSLKRLESKAQLCFQELRLKFAKDVHDTTQKLAEELVNVLQK